MSGTQSLLFRVGALVLSLAATPAFGHVPYLERMDFSPQHPFVIKDSVENSKAIYSWFSEGTDVDVVSFQVTTPVRAYSNAIVPVCPGYEDLLPRVALVGPGLPSPGEPIPFAIPTGYGAIVMDNLQPGEPRETFYEVFSNQTYYDAPFLDEEVSEPGTYYFIYWDPYHVGGDYVAVVGAREVFSPKDVVRSLVLTPFIRQGRELHTDCE